MLPSKIALCWTNALKNCRRTASAHSPNTFVVEKKTPMRLPILRSEISSKCETKLRPRHFARKRNWITRWKPSCPEYICRFIRWSLSQEFLIQQRQDVLDCKIEFFTPLSSPFSRSESSSSQFYLAALSGGSCFTTPSSYAGDPVECLWNHSVD